MSLVELEYHRSPGETFIINSKEISSMHNMSADDYGICVKIIMHNGDFFTVSGDFGNVLDRLAGGE